MALTHYLACATDKKYTKPEITHDNMCITLMLNLGWTWHGKMLAHPVDWRQACTGQAVHCLFYTILESMDMRGGGGGGKKKTDLLKVSGGKEKTGTLEVNV